jgi:phage major head subunit gpT-like protein
MDTNRANMTAFFQAMNTAFTEGMQRGPELPSDLVQEQLRFSEAAMVVPSSTNTENHGWLNQIPGFREWVGDRVVNNIATNKLAVTNKDWEGTIGVDRNDIEDDTYGLYSGLFRAMGAEGSDEALWLDMVMDALIANGNWADGAAFFKADRAYGANTICNLVTTALGAVAFELAISTMRSYKGHGNNPINVTPVILLVGPSLRSTAWDLVKNQFVSSGTGKGGAVENRTRGLCSLRVHPKLTGDYANYWFVLGQKGGIRPIAAQRRRMPRLIAKDQPNDDGVFYQKQFVYGADARGVGFLTLPHLAYCGTGAG